MNNLESTILEMINMLKIVEASMKGEQKTVILVDSSKKEISELYFLFKLLVTIIWNMDSEKLLCRAESIRICEQVADEQELHKLVVHLRKVLNSDFRMDTVISATLILLLQIWNSCANKCMFSAKFSFFSVWARIQLLIAILKQEQLKFI
ncbi:hypothetical protein ZIOFF_070714 [Zingiber officinale]|uniref:Uncharacterized protein n=1 Tax=Zingiber officinale TaxID=94328 RepID=A0A8J5C2W3_ZINOF|nr:hypothetical protein ZIOFF_070714 [Zingiber officinale]